MSEIAGQQTPGVLMIVSAPSGAGKTSISREILRMFPDIRFSVSCTTRPPRPGEVDGKDYHFISEAAFRERIARGEFVEWVENYGQLYGTSKKTMDAFLKRGGSDPGHRTPGSEGDPGTLPKGVFILILPPSLSELKTRL